MLIRLRNQRKYMGIKHLSRGIYSCDTSCIRTLDDFERCGMVTVEKKGRSSIRTITEKGKIVAKKVSEILGILGEP